MKWVIYLLQSVFIYFRHSPTSDSGISSAPVTELEDHQVLTLIHRHLASLPPPPPVTPEPLLLSETEALHLYFMVVPDILVFIPSFQLLLLVTPRSP